MSKNVFGLVRFPHRGENTLLIGVVTTQPFTLFDRDACLADRVPPVEFALATGSDPVLDPPGDFFGYPCSPPPRFVGGTRALTADELACDALIATGVGDGLAMVDALRAAGFRGAIYAPGKVGPRPDGLAGPDGRVMMTAFLRPVDGLYCLSPAL